MCSLGCKHSTAEGFDFVFSTFFCYNFFIYNTLLGNFLIPVSWVGLELWLLLGIGWCWGILIGASWCCDDDDLVILYKINLRERDMYLSHSLSFPFSTSQGRVFPLSKIVRFTSLQVKSPWEWHKTVYEIDHCTFFAILPLLFLKN